MNLVDQINTHKYLYLDRLAEITDLELELWINEARVQGSKKEVPENATFYGAIVTDELSKKYKITIKGYIVYSVTNESYVQDNKGEKFVGNLFRRYSESKFLDYAEATINVEYAEAMFDEKPKHFEIICLNHIVDVICFDDILIEELSY